MGTRLAQLFFAFLIFIAANPAFADDGAASLAAGGIVFTNRIAVRMSNEDLYINFAGLSDDGEKVVMQAYVFPLVSWIWVGYWVVLSGTIICLIPSKHRLVYPRTEVLGYAGKHAQV